ncbi:MAG: hypothetical protein LBM93_07035 [Oscillospiraceae bacterium]|nr:hypothetical protein [Oscillospiraceae bacterium]
MKKEGYKYSQNQYSRLSLGADGYSYTIETYVPNGTDWRGILAEITFENPIPDSLSTANDFVDLIGAFSGVNNPLPFLGNLDNVFDLAMVLTGEKDFGTLLAEFALFAIVRSAVSYSGSYLSAAILVKGSLGLAEVATIACPVLLAGVAVVAIWDFWGDDISRGLGWFINGLINWAIDPSGYVYEVVPENRVEGVYYQDEDGNEVLWDATELDQINPLISDSNGKYGWNVGFGQWKVKVEKDGYVSDESEWLPVPPEQTEVNIPIKSEIAPKIIAFNVYETYAEVIFDNYVKTSTITWENLILNDGNANISYQVTAVNQVENDQTDNENVAKTFKLSYKSGYKATAINSYTITTSENIMSYNAISVEQNVLTCDYKVEITDIEFDTLSVVDYDTTVQLSVNLLPGESIGGYKLSADSSDNNIAEIVEVSEISETGTATITLKTNLPGDFVLTVSVEGTDLSKSIPVSVEMTSENGRIIVKIVKLADDGNGNITINDYNILVQYILFTAYENLTYGQVEASDTYRDGNLNVCDIAVFKKFMLNSAIAKQ